MSIFAYVQPIFCPNEELFEKNKDSIISFINYYNKMNYEFQCVFGGYCVDDNHFNVLSELITNGIKNSIVNRFDKNYGKAYVVNNLVSFLTQNVQYFLTADSDIKFHIDQPDIKNRLIEAFQFSNSIEQPAGIIGLFQDENNCHILDLCYQKRYYYRDNVEMICRPERGGGMAGGCICVAMDAWKLIGGYKVLGVYASDDANLLMDCNRIGRYFFLSNSIRCIHPHETNKEYQAWKINTVGIVGDLQQSIDNANKFWNK